MTTENLSTLKIHKLTQTQYDRELANDNLDKSALYLTPDEANDLSLYATIEQMNGKADVDHTHTANEVGARPNTWMPTPEEIGAGRVNPNLLDNWYFGNPVDQRGGYVVPPGVGYHLAGDISSQEPVGYTDGYYPVTFEQTVHGRRAKFNIGGTFYYCWDGSSVRGYAGVGYGVDRWHQGTNVTTVIHDGYIHIEHTSQFNDGLIQRFEPGFFQRVTGQYMTASALLADGTLRTGTQKIVDGYTQFIWPDKAYNKVGFQLGNLNGSQFDQFSLQTTIGQTADVVAAKLEFGSMQTLAHQDENGNWVLNEIPNYDEQLLRCCMSTADSGDTYANNKKTAAQIGAMENKGQLSNYSTVLAAATLETKAGYSFFAVNGNSALHDASDSPFGARETQYFVLVDNTDSRRRTLLAYEYGSHRFASRDIFDGNWLTQWAEYATTDYALPRDGSKAMTGDLMFNATANSHKFLKGIDNFAALGETRSNGVWGQLLVSADGPAFQNCIDGSNANYYTILHAGNYGSLMAGGTINGNLTVNGTITGTTVKGAIWNDYAEYREADILEPGRVVCENGDDTLSLSTERLQAGANIISDTFGFSIGETELAKTPIAVSGRVLAYPYEDRNSYKPGDAVCAAPNGTVSKMTREEIREYPDRIIGTVSSVPNYETWGTGNVPVNGRIWIKVK